MRKICISTSFFFLSFLIYANELELSNNLKIRYEKILYKVNKPENSWFGDGLHCFVAKINEDDLDKFMKENILKNPSWHKAPLNQEAISTIKFIERWLAVNKETKNLEKIYNLTDKIKSSSLYYRVVHVKYNSLKDISNATIYIIDMELNYIIMLNADT